MTVPLMRLIGGVSIAVFIVALVVISVIGSRWRGGMPRRFQWRSLLPVALGVAVLWFLPVGRVHSPIAIGVGTAFIVMGSALAVCTYIQLGRHKVFSPDPEPVPASIVLMSGPYRLVRHPAYAGIVLMAFGCALSYQLFGLLAAGGAVAWAWRQSAEEERHQLERNGNAYRQLMRRTPRRLAPGDQRFQ